DERHLDVEKQVMHPEPFDPREERVFQLPQVERAFRKGLPFFAAADVDADKFAEDAVDGVVLSPRVDEVDGEHGIEEDGAKIDPAPYGGEKNGLKVIDDHLPGRGKSRKEVI